ncbi:MAG: hypothetical protein N2Z60_05200 [Elusimicrobiales bacterium]|nr:hypothetical protein [Elusimicrobiales bacterium]HOJ85591.1 hypothetical protein [Elusimicrobiales bacterium]HPO94990.1 hypothetical protein [Elusimicrobiales bacterium]
MSISIKKGSILIHNVFDVGWEINLSRAEALFFSKQKNSLRFKFSKDPRKAIIIKEAPLEINVGNETIKINEKDYDLKLHAKIWDYGAISITSEIILSENTDWKEIVSLGKYLEETQDIELLAKKIKDEIKNIIIDSIKLPQEWEQFEDYITYFFESVEGLKNPREIFDKVDVASLILGESDAKLSSIASVPITENYIQYYENDMAIIDWDAAIVIEPNGSRDIPDGIEFSLTHLLELRYYDYLIDKKLDILYDSLENENKKFTKIFKFNYSKISEEATKNYIEFSDLLGKIENSFKTVGDPYIATVFRTCAEQFRFDDWHNSITRKMNTLFQITQVIQAELNAIRGHILEIIIILLIAIEIIPMLF